MSSVVQVTQYWPSPMLGSLMASFASKRLAAHYTRLRNEAYHAGDNGRMKDVDIRMTQAIVRKAVRRGEAAVARLHQGLTVIIKDNPAEYTRVLCTCTDNFLLRLAKSKGLQRA